MAGNNRSVRRAICEILWRAETPLTKEQILTHLIEEKWALLTQPTANSLGSLLSKNPQIKKCDNERIFSGDGRYRSVPTFEINRDLIHEYNDILLTYPHNALMKRERELAVVCKSSGRTRIFPEGENQCLHCIRQP